jgi:hypothetical protein
MPIPASTNEMGFFQTAFERLCDTYGDLFEVVTYDAGVSSEANGRAVVEAHKHYVFRLKNESRYMYRMAEQLCDPDDVAAQSEDVFDNHTTVTRRLVIVPVERHWAYGRDAANERKKPDDSIWEHTKTFLRVESLERRDGVVVERDVRFWNTSLAHDALTPEQWLELVRLHWAVENNNHHTLDTAFAEDDRPWITGDARGTLAVVLLRRIAYTVLTLFRSVTQRSEERRAMRWKVLLSWVRDTLVGATEGEVARLRPRKAAAVPG